MQVTVTIVTYNSAQYIRKCLEHVLRQDFPRLEVVVLDNASSDNTLAELDVFSDRIQIIRNRRNSGFAAGQNRAIAASHGDWVLTLNPDVRLNPDFISTMIRAAGEDPGIGTVCGKLLAMGGDFEIPEHSLFDSTGIYMTPNFRHLDRGSQLPDQGQFDKPEYVFGATGAAALFRRKLIDDISIDGEFFDSDFFAYREDADVAWRAQLFGWKCLYTPEAVAYHVRRVLPSTRRSHPSVINMHSVKNRFLMRIKNTTGDLYRRNWLAATLRDCVVVAGCLLREWPSLRAFPILLRAFPRTWAKRRQIMKKRRVANAYIAGWFLNTPVSYAAGLDRAQEKVARS